MNETIELKNVTKSFGDFRLNNLSFTVKKGFITGFIGPNGSGKTSTIKLIMNLLKKDAGQINVFGMDPEKHEKEVKQRIGFVYSENYFFEERTIEEIKNFVSLSYKNWDDVLFAQYATKFQLPRNKKIKTLSTGMKMKFSLALALSHHADLLILDEPTSGLDPVIRMEVLDILAELARDQDKTIFFSTHITSDLDRLADYVTFIYKGQLVFSKAKDDILSNYRVVKGPCELLNENTQGVLMGIRKSSVGFEALTSQIDRAQELLQGKAVLEVPSLEDIMVFTVRRNKNA